MLIQTILGAATATAALLAGSAVSANVFNFTFTGENLPLSITGQITTTGVDNGVFGQDVTNLTGTVNGSAFTYVANPNAPNLNFFTENSPPNNIFQYDDNFNPKTDSPDSAGLVFTVGNIAYNLYYASGQMSVLSYTAGATQYNPQVNGVLAVPEPASWSLLILGMAGLGAALRGRVSSGLRRLPV